MSIVVESEIYKSAPMCVFHRQRQRGHHVIEQKDGEGPSPSTKGTRLANHGIILGGKRIRDSGMFVLG